MKSLLHLYRLFNRREKVTLVGVLTLMLLGSFLEVLGIGLVFPYIALLQDTHLPETNPIISLIYSSLRFQSYKSFSICLSVLLLTMFIAKAGFNLWLNNFQTRFVYAKQQELGRRLLTSYLCRPYTFFLSTNTSTLISNLTTSLVQVSAGVLQSALAFATEIFITGGVVCFLFYLDPVFSLLAVVFVALVTLCFLRTVRSRVAFYASENDSRWKAMVRLVNEGLSSTKEIQVLGRQCYFINAYTEECRHYAATLTKYNTLMQLPRAGLETAVVGGMVLFASFAILSGRFEKNLFPILAVFAVAAVRIVPSANRIIQAWSSISFYSPSIEVVRHGLQQSKMSVPMRADPSRMVLRETVKIRVDSFRYPANSSFHLEDINITLKQGDSVALIGHSGSGKTTLVDVILGLFPEFEGQILVDGTDIRDDISNWRARIGYIPQTTYLSDDTILKNVAFGIADAEIDLPKVERAVALAGLAQVIDAQPSGILTVVGDRGIRLSGGERQRIGIARALYHDPDLLILDEATSALDHKTERQIVESILGLSPLKTIIVIAHRLTTVQSCSRLYLMQKGRIVDQGTFDNIASRHPEILQSTSSHQEYQARAVIET